MNLNLKTSLKWFAFAAIVAVLWVAYGCSAPQRFHKIVNVCAEVRIVADRSQFDCHTYPAGTGGYYYKTFYGRNVIYILGGTDNGQIYMTDKWLGHEFLELMSAENKDILNPHDYKFWMK